MEKVSHRSCRQLHPHGKRLSAPQPVVQPGVLRLKLRRKTPLSTPLARAYSPVCFQSGASSRHAHFSSQSYCLTRGTVGSVGALLGYLWSFCSLSHPATQLVPTFLIYTRHTRGTAVIANRLPSPPSRLSVTRASHSSVPHLPYIFAALWYFYSCFISCVSMHKGN